MSNSNRFTITGASWAVTAQDASGTNVSVSYSPPVTRESYTTLNNEIANASGTLDLTGRSFAPTAAEVAAATGRVSTAIMNTSGSELTITGGTYYGGVSLGWGLADGSGIRSASLAENINNNVSGYFDFDGTAKLHDEEANDVPFMAVYPTPPEGMKYSPATSAPSTWLLGKWKA